MRETSSYHFRSEQMDVIASNIINCETAHELAQHLWSAAKLAGFSYASVFVLSLGREGTPFRSKVCTSLPNSWLKLYRKRNYQLIDPVPREAYELQAPKLITRKLDDPPLVQSFWENAIRENVGSAVWVNTTNCIDGSKIAVTFNSFSPEQLINENLRWNESDLVVISDLAAEAFVRMNSIIGDIKEPLSVAELRFLQMLCNGHDLSHDGSTTANHEQSSSLQISIRRKLGVRSLTQAAVIAMNRGWFDELPWEHGEISTPYF